MDVVALGVLLGLGAGLAPGPLLALVAAAALDRGFAAGARIAAAPLLTDVPIIALCVLVLRDLPAEALAALSFAGAAFVLWLAREALRSPADTAAPTPRADLGRAALVNALSPHPWLFWLAVGGPLLVDAADESLGLAAAFLVAFYALLIGTKVALAAAAASARNRTWRRLVPGRLTARFGAPEAVVRVGGVRLIAAALLTLAAVGLVIDGLSRL